MKISFQKLLLMYLQNKVNKKIIFITRLKTVIVNKTYGKLKILNCVKNSHVQINSCSLVDSFLFHLTSLATTAVENMAPTTPAELQT